MKLPLDSADGLQSDADAIRNVRRAVGADLEGAMVECGETGGAPVSPRERKRGRLERPGLPGSQRSNRGSFRCPSLGSDRRGRLERFTHKPLGSQGQ